MTETPLSGKSILVTRARAQAGSLAQRLEALGGTVIECPTIEIQPAADFAALDDALEKIDSYSWLILTSVNSVEPLLSRLVKLGKSVADLDHLKVAAIGSETAKRLAAAGVAVDIVPTRFQAEGILDSLNAAMVRGKKILIPRAAKARDVLPETLRQRGATVDVVEAYRTVAPKIDLADIQGKLQSGEIDWVTFTSSSTVSNFVLLFGGAKLSQTLGHAAIACIGPITADTVEEMGGQVAVVADQFTIDGLVRALVEHLRAGNLTAPSNLGPNT